jgi:hypothetical protein
MRAGMCSHPIVMSYLAFYRHLEIFCDYDPEWELLELT